ncbi:ATP-binding protein [Desulfonatronovibrio magnus]|uniref:ATP-binding protein n=1 Tax=Desulfonatronovibrio magnus TaxID=698827 RepID=UPI0012F9A094|nr:ATP-binding protein [Desulfonatronovibrio magnus]
MLPILCYRTAVASLKLANSPDFKLITPCSLLVQDLLVAKRELSLAKQLKKLSRYHALIIDDIGYLPAQPVPED